MSSPSFYCRLNRKIVTTYCYLSAKKIRSVEERIGRNDLKEIRVNINGHCYGHYCFRGLYLLNRCYGRHRKNSFRLLLPPLCWEPYLYYGRHWHYGCLTCWHHGLLLLMCSVYYWSSWQGLDLHFCYCWFSLLLYCGYRKRYYGWQ
jgi:hypothetical protein